MTMIKGIIETERELVQKVIYFGNSPAHLNKDGNWISNETKELLRETDLGSLMDEEES